MALRSRGQTVILLVIVLLWASGAFGQVAKPAPGIALPESQPIRCRCVCLGAGGVRVLLHGLPYPSLLYQGQIRSFYAEPTDSQDYCDKHCSEVGPYIPLMEKTHVRFGGTLTKKGVPGFFAVDGTKIGR